MRYLILIILISCNSEPVKEEPKHFDTTAFVINTDSVLQDVGKMPVSKGIATRAAAASISDIVISNTPDIVWTKTRTGNVVYLSGDVISTNLGIPIIQAEIKRLR